MRSSLVRELARQYAAGALSLNEYRARRRELIDEIVAGKTPLRYRDALLHAALGDRGTRARLHVVAVLILMVAIAALTWLVWYLPASPQQQRAPVSRQHTVYAAQAPGPFLVQQFLKDNVWSLASLNRFEAKWNRLTSEQRAEAKHSVWFRRLAAELQQRINAQQALAALDSKGGATTQLLRLQAFAAHLGLRTSD